MHAWMLPRCCTEPVSPQLIAPYLLWRRDPALHRKDPNARCSYMVHTWTFKVLPQHNIWVWPETGDGRVPPPSVTNPCRGPLCRVLQCSVGLLQGGFVARPPRFCYKQWRKRLPGPVTSPMFLGVATLYSCGMWLFSACDMGELCCVRKIKTCKAGYNL